MYDLGLRLKEIRLQRGYTQESLARKINKSKTTISSYETNAQMPPLDVLISIASVYNVSLDYLVGFDSDLVYSVKHLSNNQREILEDLYREFSMPSSCDGMLSPSQISLLQKIIMLFSKQQ